MNRLYAIHAAGLSTSATADHRLSAKPSAIDGLAADLYAAVSGGSAGSGPNAKWIAAVAKDLLANRGASVVIAGEHLSPETQAFAHAINSAIGANGSTVSYINRVSAGVENQGESLKTQKPAPP